MRCLVRSAGAMLAMVWSGAAAAIAGPVSIRTSSDLLRSAAVVRLDDGQRTGDAEELAELASHLAALRQSWFPDDVMPAPVLVPVPAVSAAAAATRPAAVMIPLPPAAWSGIAGLGCAAVAARLLNPPLRAWRRLQ